ncbi:hypothetical protein [Phytopseudomonas daroniae]|uniref:hypothetical protein n=1 Tax=Phytopseudomonas daroniae TaxID=2487519 RepID=UPI00103858B5|nr:hypothetical protein [Pseudomonas daroniae]
MSKMSAYRNFKRRERATKLAAENNITFEEALAQIEAREKKASETLSKIAKSRSKERNTKKEKSTIRKNMTNLKNLKKQYHREKCPFRAGHLASEKGSAHFVCELLPN